MKLAENIRKKTNKLIGYGIWVLIVLLLLSVTHNAQTVGRISAQIAAEKAKVTKMEKDNAELANQIAITQSQDFIERQIRNKLGLVMSGEAIIVLPDVDTLRKLAPPEIQDQEVLPEPNWKRWLKLFI